MQSFDLRGHGRSQGKRCFVRAFDEYLDDAGALLLRAKRRWPGRPRVPASSDGLWHEIMHEPEKGIVLQEMSGWLDERMSRSVGGARSAV